MGKTLEVACSDKNSREYAGLYEFLLTLFVEVDEGCKGEISFNEFNGLIERAEAWGHDKSAFAQWCSDASKNPNSKAKRELYGFLTMAFGDVDVDKDGKINAQEFDFLCEKVASMPRSFGLAPSWQAEYGGSVDKRTAARKVMFDAIDAKAGSARGWIGCAQFVDWAFTHVAGKAGTIGGGEVDLYHVQNYSEGDLLKTLEV